MRTTLTLQVAVVNEIHSSIKHGASAFVLLRTGGFVQLRGTASRAEISLPCKCKKLTEIPCCKTVSNCLDSRLSSREPAALCSRPTPTSSPLKPAPPSPPIRSKHCCRPDPLHLNQTSIGNHVAPFLAD